MPHGEETHTYVCGRDMSEADPPDACYSVAFDVRDVVGTEFWDTRSQCQRLCGKDASTPVWNLYVVDEPPPAATPSGSHCYEYKDEVVCTARPGSALAEAALFSARARVADAHASLAPAVTEEGAAGRGTARGASRQRRETRRYGDDERPASDREYAKRRPSLDPGRARKRSPSDDASLGRRRQRDDGKRPTERRASDDEKRPTERRESDDEKGARGQDPGDASREANECKDVAAENGRHAHHIEHAADTRAAAGGPQRQRHHGSAESHANATGGQRTRTSF